MAQYEFQVADYERIFRKRYKIVLLSVACALAFSVMFARMKVPQYTSTATVKVDRNSVMGFDMESVVYGSWDNIETQTKVITSFPVLLDAAKRMRLVADSVSDDMYSSDERTLNELERLRGQISASLSGSTNMIQIQGTSINPTEARDLANAVAFSYKNFSVRGKKAHAIKTKQFVEDQLTLCRNDLLLAEQEVKAFEESQSIPSIDENVKSTIDRASKIQNEIAMLDDALIIIEAQKSKLAERFSERPSHRASDSPAPTDGRPPSDSAVVPAGSMSWVSDFTDQDPGIRQLNDRLLQLQLQLNDQMAYYKTGHPANKDIEGKIKETINQMLADYSKKTKQLTEKRLVVLKEKELVDAELQKLPGNEMQYSRLLRKMKVNDELFTLLSKKLQEAMIAEAGVVDDVTIMSIATMPRSATNKGVGRIGLLGIILGLLIGIILAVVREMFDTSIGTIEEVERTLKMVVLAVIPHIQFEEQSSGGNNSRKRHEEALPASMQTRPGLVTQFMPKEPCAEAYRILRTNLEYLSYQRPIKTMLLTSATMQEGKSTTLANLAITFAQQGKRILILECNLRRPSLYRLFGLEKGPGMADILIEKAKWQNCVRNVTDLALGEFALEEILNIPGLENFHIITYGHTPPNPAELLSSPKFEQIIAEVRDHFDFILVDGPPLLPVADSMVLSTKVDGVGLIYKAGSVPRSTVKLAKERLETVHANVLGLVLNDIRPETSGTHYAAVYSRYYGKDDSRKRKRSRSVAQRLPVKLL